LRTRETVERDTPARAAMCSIVCLIWNRSHGAGYVLATRLRQGWRYAWERSRRSPSGDAKAA